MAETRKFPTPSNKVTPTCKACAFVGYRNSDSRQIMEVEEGYRSMLPSITTLSPAPICFLDIVDLSLELPEGAWYSGQNIQPILLKERPGCKDAFLPYRPGYSPRERAEMIDREMMRHDQVIQTRWNLGIALTGVLVAVIGIGISAYFNMQAAQVQAAAQIRSAELQIEFQKMLLTPTPSVTYTPTPAPGTQ